MDSQRRMKNLATTSSSSILDLRACSVGLYRGLSNRRLQRIDIRVTRDFLFDGDQAMVKEKLQTPHRLTRRYAHCNVLHAIDSNGDYDRRYQRP
jgi:hypothetical protein